jgi:hypothetical protein
MENEGDEERFVDRFYAVVCQSALVLRILLSIEILLVFLSVIALPFNSPGTASRNIIYINLLMNLPVLAAILGLIYACNSHG